VIRRTAALMIVVLAVTGACSTDGGTPAAPPPASASPAAAPAGSPSSGIPPGRASGAAPAPAPGQASGPAPGPAATVPSGRLAIASREIAVSRGRSRPLPTTVWYPTEGGGPFPLVLFSHGLTSEPSAYADVLRPWARAGFVVAAPAYPHTSYRAEDFDAVDVINQPADASHVITRLLALNDRAGDPLAGRIDTGRIAAAGHSAGGITTIGLFSGDRDDRLDAGIVFSGRRVLPVPFAGDPAPMLFVHGKRDRTVRYAEGLSAFNAVPWPKAMMAVTEGGHVAITKDFPPVIATTTDFLRYALYGDRRAKDRLGPDATRGRRATLIDRL
jgi:dienelactone hydrolase